jgi:hypothetical protein
MMAGMIMVVMAVVMALVIMVMMMPVVMLFMIVIVMMVVILVVMVVVMPVVVILMIVIMMVPVVVIFMIVIVIMMVLVIVILMIVIMMVLVVVILVVMVMVMLVDRLKLRQINLHAFHRLEDFRSPKFRDRSRDKGSVRIQRPQQFKGFFHLLCCCEAGIRAAQDHSSRRLHLVTEKLAEVLQVHPAF